VPRLRNPDLLSLAAVLLLLSLRQADLGQAAAFGVVLMLLSAGVFFLAGENRGTSG